MLMKQEPGKAMALEAKIHLHLLTRPHTSETLAVACGASVPTVARAIARLREALRKAGLELVSVRASGGYRYEIYGSEDHGRRGWLASRLRGLAGSVPAAKISKPMKPEDEAIYGRDW